MRARRVRLRAISTIAGTINVAHAAPRIRPVINREVNVFAHTPKNPSDQSMVIGTSARNSHIRDIGSIESIRRHNG